jgi:hypothetical protein
MRTARVLVAALAIGASFTLSAPTLRAMSGVPEGAITLLRAPGLYRITITGPRGAPSRHIDIVLDEGTGQMAGYLVSDSSSSMLDDLRIEDGTLRATVMTSLGRGALSVKMFGDQLTGTLTIDKQVFSVQGVRAL